MEWNTIASQSHIIQNYGGNQNHEHTYQNQGGAPIFINFHLSYLPIVFPRPLMYYIPQEPTLETKIRYQVHYYFSKENLIRDDFMRKRMNDEGFVHIEFIASFNKLKALTRNIQLILNALRDSDVVELKGYEIRSRHMWRQFLMPLYLRTPFHPNLEDSTGSS